MNNKSKVVLALVTTACVGGVAGCGETKYNISTSVENDEYGYITGGGNYAIGDRVTLKIYPNEGCKALSVQFNDQEVGEDKRGGRYVSSIYDQTGKLSHYEHSFVVGLENDTIGKYTAYFECSSNTAEDVDRESTNKNLVTFEIWDGNTPIDSLTTTEEVVVGRKVSERPYLDGLEGKITWYTSKNYIASDIYDFNNPVYDPLTLYGRVMNKSPKSIIEDAVNNFKSASKINMKIGGFEAKIKEYNKLSDNGIEFTFLENGSDKFIIKGRNYYERFSDGYYDLDMNGNNFDIKYTDIEKFNMFFSHLIDFEDSSYSYEPGDITSITDDNRVDISVGEETIKCTKYTIKKDDSTFLELFINKGTLYRVIEYIPDGDPIINDITYPEGTGTSIDLSSVSKMHMIKIESNSENLNKELDELKINTHFENKVVVRPSKYENLDTLLNSQQSNLKDVLKRYYYKVKTKGCASEIDGLKQQTTDNTVICLDVLAEYKDVYSALENLKTGNYRIETSMRDLDDNLISKEFVVNSKENVFEIVNKPDSMNIRMWNSIEFLKTILLKDFYHFTYVSDEYAFYKEETDSEPFMRLKLDASGRVSQIVHYEKNALGWITNSYTSTVDYGSRDYLMGLGIIKEGIYDVTFSGGNYRSLDGIDLTSSQARKPEGIDEGLWNVLQSLNDLANKEKYVQTNNAEQMIFTFTSKDSSKIFTITLNSKNEITTIKFNNGTEKIYEFDYRYKDYVTAVDELTTGRFDIKENNSIIYREEKGVDLSTLSTNPGLPTDLWNAIKKLNNDFITESLYNFETSNNGVYVITSKTNSSDTCQITISNGKVMLIKIGNKEYKFDYIYRDYFGGLENVEEGWLDVNGNDTSYREELGNDVTHQDTSLPGSLDTDNGRIVWEILQELDNLINAEDYSVKITDVGYLFSKNDGTVAYEVTIENGYIAQVVRIQGSGMTEEKVNIEFNYIYRDYLKALSVLKKGYWGVSSSVAGQNVEYREDKGINIFAEPTKPEGMDTSVWKMLIENVANFGDPSLYSVEYEGTDFKYIFKKGQAQYEVVLNNGKIHSVKYIADGYGEIRSLTFDYSYSGYLQALNSLGLGMFDIVYDDDSYFVDLGVDITTLEEKPEDMNDAVWVAIKYIGQFTDSQSWILKQFDEADGTYVFGRGYSDNNYVVTVIDGRIQSVEYGGEVYRFDHTMKAYYQKALQSIKSGFWAVQYGDKSYYEKEGNDVFTSLPADMDENLKEVLNYIKSLSTKPNYAVQYDPINNGYLFTNSLNSGAVVCKVFVKDGIVTSIVREEVTYTFNYNYADYLSALENLKTDRYDLIYSYPLMVGYGHSTYTNAAGDNLLDEDNLPEELKRMFKMLGESTNTDKYSASVIGNQYSFTSLQDGSVYTVSINNNKISTVSVGDYTCDFDYKLMIHYLMAVEGSIMKGKWDVTFGGEKYRAGAISYEDVFIEESVPEGMNQGLFNAIHMLEDFIQDDTLNVTYDQESDSYIYVVDGLARVLIKDGKVKCITYNDVDYTFDYTYQEYLLALESIEGGSWDVTFGAEVYREKSSANLTVESVRPTDMSDTKYDGLWAMLQELDNLSDSSLYQVSNSANVYTFVKSSEGMTTTYIVTINELGEIISIKVVNAAENGGTTEVEYTFNYQYTPYLKGLNRVVAGDYSVTVGESQINIEDHSAVEKPIWVPQELWDVLQLLDDFVDTSKYDMTIENGGFFTYKYKFVDKTNDKEYEIGVLDNLIQSIEDADGIYYSIEYN